MVKSVWKKISDLLCARIESQAYDAWIKPLSCLKLENKELFIEVPDLFFKEWLEANYLSPIKDAASEVIQDTITLQFVVNEKKIQKNKTPVTRLAQTQPLIASNITSRYRFDNFVVGSSNQFAHAACFSVANNPALNYNPLFLFAGAGLGKTHLLKAIGYHAIQNNICSKVLYISSEQFTNDLINSIRYEKMADFRERFRTLSLLLIDDIQFIAGKERNQEEFFHTFNTLYESHQQIVMTSDTPPKDMHSLEERLRSRFEWGLIADIQPPDTETKVAIIKQKLRGETVVLPNDVAFFLASNVKSNIRELEGLLTRVVAYASLNKCDITLDLAKDVLKDIIKTREKELTIGIIQKEVCNYFNIKLSDLKSVRKQKNIVMPRQICMYLARNLTKLSFPEIGAQFGGKDHSTIIYAVNKIEKALQHDKQLQNHVNTITGKLTGR